MVTVKTVGPRSGTVTAGFAMVVVLSVATALGVGTHQVGSRVEQAVIVTMNVVLCLVSPLTSSSRRLDRRRKCSGGGGGGEEVERSVQKGMCARGLLFEAFRCPHRSVRTTARLRSMTGSFSMTRSGERTRETGKGAWRSHRRAAADDWLRGTLTGRGEEAIPCVGLGDRTMGGGRRHCLGESRGRPWLRPGAQRPGDMAEKRTTINAKKRN